MNSIAGYTFKTPSILSRAIIHPNTGVPSLQFQRLEFLGDACLKLAATDYLFTEHPNESEGQLNNRLIALVSASACKDMATLIGLNKILKVADKTEFAHSSVYSDAFEAVIGAVYEDSGKDMKVTGDWIKNILKQLKFPSEQSKAKESNDAKSQLQDLSQKMNGSLPIYETVSNDGPAHDRRFIVCVSLNWLNDVGMGEGRSLKAAQSSAASDLMSKII